MMASLINRKQLKAETKVMLQSAQVSPKAMTALYLGITLVLNLLSSFSGGSGILSLFVSVLISLMSMVLTGGFILYCMAIRRGERAEFLTLFDGFSFVGRIIILSLLIQCLTSMWAMLFIIPGIVAHYRYRFALLNLYENPELGILNAMNLSSRQTYGYKRQLLMMDISYLGWSILASFPNLIYNSILLRESFRLTSDYMKNPGGLLPVIDPSVLILPDWAWILISGLWALAVALIYLPQRRCTEVGFFEIARAHPADLSTPSLPE
jgi:uncharacterized membrane protein